MKKDTTEYLIPLAQHAKEEKKSLRKQRGKDIQRDY